MAIDLLTSTTTSKYTGMTPTTAVYSANDVFTPPSGYSTSRALLCDITLIGAGGGGAGLTNYIAGSGGNAGQVVSATGVPVTAPLTVRVGTGGSGGAPGSAGGTGGDSSFGSLTARGGVGGAAASVTAPTATFGMPDTSAGALGGYSSLVVGVQASTGISLSTDGISSWTGGTLPQSATGRLPAYGNGIWVVPGNGFVLTSTDAVNWTKVQLNVGTIFNVAYGNGKFAMTASVGNYIWYSTDGLVWTSAAVPAPGTSGQWTYVLYGNGTWVIAGNGMTAAPYIIYSSDLINWTASASTMTSNGAYQKGVFAEGVFTIVNTNGNITAGAVVWTSTDGRVWSANATLTSWVGSTDYIGDIAYVNGWWVVTSMGTANKVWHTQTPGSGSWAQVVTSGPGNSYPNLSSANGLMYAAVGTNTFYTTTDTTTWTQRGATNGILHVCGRPATTGSAPTATTSLNTLLPGGGAGGNGNTNGDGGGGGTYQGTAAATGTSSAAATAGQVAGAGGGGGGLGSTGGAAGASGQVVVTYWQ